MFKLMSFPEYGHLSLLLDAASCFLTFNILEWTFLLGIKISSSIITYVCLNLNGGFWYSNEVFFVFFIARFYGTWISSDVALGSWQLISAWEIPASFVLSRESLTSFSVVVKKCFHLTLSAVLWQRLSRMNSVSSWELWMMLRSAL